MGLKGRLLFDLNEPPTENEDDNGGVVCFQPTRPSHLQPFVRPKVVQGSDIPAESRSSGETDSNFASLSKSSNAQDRKASVNLQTCSVDAQTTEKDEDEWSDAEGSVDACRRSVIHEDSSGECVRRVQEEDIVAMMESNASAEGVENNCLDPGNVKIESTSPLLVLNPETNDKKCDRSTDGQEDSGPGRKERGFRGIEACHALKCSNNFGKRPKLGRHKEAMLGKKRNRQTMFLNLEDVKQAGSLKTSTPRKQIPAPAIARTVKEAHPAPPSAERGDKQAQPIIRDAKWGDQSIYEDNNVVESTDCTSESNGDDKSGTIGPPRRLNSSIDLPSEGQAPPVSRQSFLNHSLDTKQFNLFSGRKPAVSSYSSADPKLSAKKLPSKKQTFVNQYQDSSVECLLREVTNEKFWHHPEEEELQCVPGRFDSVEEYINVFEPLLFEECRAQLYSNWEESSETVSSHVRVGIKSIERRERGWFDVILIPTHEYDGHIRKEM